MSVRLSGVVAALVLTFVASDVYAKPRLSAEQCRVAEAISHRHVTDGAVLALSPEPSIHVDGLDRGWVDTPPDPALLKKFEQRRKGTAFDCTGLRKRLKKSGHSLAGRDEARIPPGTSSVQIGEPVISESGESALVYVGVRGSGLAGSETLYLLKRVDGAWRIFSARMISIS